MKYISSVTLTIAVLFSAFAGFAQQQNPNITVQELKDHIYFLASDSLKGRKPGTPEGKIAAEYIRDQFKNAGLSLLSDEGFQHMEVVNDVSPGEKNMLQFNGFEGVLHEDFIPMSFSANTSVDAPIVFAGYGFDISEDSLQWNDYNRVDVSGKWVMIFRGDPEPDNMASAFIPYTMERSKVVTATDQHAAGVIFVTPESVDEKDKLNGMFYDKTSSAASIPVISVTRAVADKLLTKSGKTVKGLEEKLIQEMKPLSFVLNQTVSATADVVIEKATTQNVVAMIDAHRDEYVVLGAHYDHLGMGGPGSGSRMPDTIAYHNGADDNASGVAGIIEMVEKLQANRDKLSANVVVIAFAAEEMGLLGSKYFTQNSLFPKDKIKVMMNFDMIGRMDPQEKGISVGGVGTAKEFEAIINKHNDEKKFHLKISKDGYGPSDHAAFYADGVPVLFFSTGAHDDYHTPFDDADRIDYRSEKVVLDFAYKLMEDILDTEALTFQKSGEKTRGHQRTRLKVTFGIIPDYAGKVEKGLGIDGVRDGGPAEKGGMKKGDVIVAIDGQPVGDIYEYMHRLQKLKAGKRVNVDIMRNGQKKVLIIEL